MSPIFPRILFQNSVFAWMALLTVFLLLIPLTAMFFTNEVRWSFTDFILMGLLLFGAGSTFVILIRKLPRKYWLVSTALLVVALVYVWAELSVGIFTSLGN